MKRNRPPSGQTRAVLAILEEAPADWRHGYALCQLTGLKAGVVYPILMRLADRGWLETQWEPVVQAGRPPRHLYRLTESGLAVAQDLLSIATPAMPSRLRPKLAS